MFDSNSDFQRSSSTVCFGAGKSAAYGGTIRQSGGKIGERGAVFEEDYFHRNVSWLQSISHNNNTDRYYT